MSRACLVTLTLFAVSCGPEPAAPKATERAADRPIINGKRCTAANMGAAVAIITDATMNIWGYKLPVRTVSCTGTLIAPDVVLTAAHCVTPSMLAGGMGTVENARYYISFTPDLSSLVMDQTSMMGGKTPALPADAVEASVYLPNPTFDPKLLTQFKGGLTNLYDVALIFLKKEITTVKPAVVITKEEAKQLAVNKKVRIAGWGQQTAAKQNPFVPPAKGTLGVKVCAETTINELGTHEMQIGSDAASARKCHGDSGGPTFMTVTTNHAINDRVVGITSHAYDLTDCAKGGVDTRVDAWLDWVDTEMKKGCTDKKRSWCKVTGIIPPSHYDPPAAPDLGPTSTDGGAPADSGVDAGGGEDDGCAVAGATGCGNSLWLLLLGALLLRRQRRG